jgi:hypothetical protein
MLVSTPLHSLEHSLEDLIVHVSESLVGAASGQGDEDTTQFHKCHLLSNVEGIAGQTHNDARGWAEFTGRASNGTRTEHVATGRLGSGRHASGAPGGAQAGLIMASLMGMWNRLHQHHWLPPHRKLERRHCFCLLRQTREVEEVTSELRWRLVDIVKVVVWSCRD